MLFVLEFIAFPKKDNAILAQFAKTSKIEVESSGSMGYFYDNKCQLTRPNLTLTSNEKQEWCSNIAKSNDAKTWISYSIENKAMKLTGYSVRNGCCYYSCCCTEDSNFIDYDCCCRLYSFSLQGSNDNRTWKVVHKIEKKKDFYFCKFETYEFSETESFRYIRLVQDEPYPGCIFCMAINQIEFYGKLCDSFGAADEQDYDNDESVSIIGKIRHE
jgi:hypothetical protein